MTNTTAHDPAEPAQLVHWPHSGIDAPTTLAYRLCASSQDARDSDFAVELHHPELGHIGWVCAEGTGGAAMFVPSDHERFSRRDMARYVEQCLGDGKPLGLEERLLDAVLYEQNTAQTVDAMRRNNTTLVREFTEFPGGGGIRGDVAELHRIAIMREDRELRAKILDESPRTRRAFGGDWQIYNGREWKPLLVPQTLAQDEIAAKLDAIRVSAQRKTTVDGLYANGVQWHARHPYYVLASDELPVNHRAWCTCRIGPAPR